MRDRSLDEFGTGETAADEREDDEEATATDAEAEEADTEAASNTDGAEADTEAAPDAAESADTTVEPALSTYDWTPGGADCGRCGETVEKRWRNGDGSGEALVCADCKEW